MSRKSLALLYLCLFFSGSAGLAYEVLWTRLLGLFFGHTVYAVTTVLAAFMGGLALGSWLIGRWADRTDRPLRLYGLLEIAIGLSCLAIPALLDQTRSVYLSFYPLLAENTALKTFLQFLLSFTVLLLPTVLMGGTLPAVAKGTVKLRDETGKGVSLLYGTNTMGAAAGAVAAGYWLLPAIGVRGTNLLGVAANLAVGVVVLGTFRSATVRRPGGTVSKAPAERRTALERTLLLGFFLSGAVSMAYQVAWVRALVLVIGSSTYAFTSILVTFLLGLALGSYLFKLFSRGENPWFFGVLQLGIGLAAFLLVPFFDYLPQIFLLLFREYDGSFRYILLIQFLMVFPFVLIPTLLMGMTFPCVAGILTRRVESVGSDVGRLYAWNTLGAIAGSVVAGFVLIPSLGAQHTIALGIGINVAVGAAIVSLAHPPLRPFLAAAALPVAALLLLFPSWNRKAMVSGVATRPEKYLQQDGSLSRERLYEDPEILYFREGIGSTVAVTQEPKGNVVFRINGKPSASYLDMETNVKLAHIPLMLHTRPRRVAIIGLGSGVTAGTVALFGGVEKIDVVELNREVVDIPSFFSNQNFSVLDDPRVTVHIDDGRSYLAGKEQRYDVIISAPSNPWIAGVSNLFTVEFTSMVKSRLAPGGVYAEWLQGYSLDPRTFKLIVRTFREVFPEASLWETSSLDYLLIGTRDGWEPRDLKDLEKSIEENPRLAEAFPNVFRDHPLWAIFRSFMLDGEELAAFSGAGPRNSDNRNILEFKAPKELYSEGHIKTLAEIREMQRSSFPDSFSGDGPVDQEILLRFGRYLLERDLPDRASAEFSRLPTLAPPRPEGARILTLEEPASLSVDFNGGSPVSLLPQLGFYRPEEGNALSRWEAYLSHFTRVSGLVPGEGVEEGTALQIGGLDGIKHVSYFLPLVVEPSAYYRISFSLRSDMGEKGEGGVGVLEYDIMSPPERQPSRVFNSTHRIRGEDRVRIKGAQPEWKRHSFSLRATPSSRMAFLVFYREGAMDAGRIFFDNLTIERLPE